MACFYQRRAERRFSAWPCESRCFAGNPTRPARRKEERGCSPAVASVVDDAPEEVRRTIPLLVIDDEADQASVDTRGTYQTEAEPLPPDYEEPSVINRLIRHLLRKFQRRAYVAYTATPFANILIPHDTFDPQRENDLYPKDFIVDLPRPPRYFGAEELFGRFDSVTGEDVGGMDVIRDIPDNDLQALAQGLLPASLETAILDFVLAGAARTQRGQGTSPMTMLVHVSHLVVEQLRMAALVDQRFTELKDEWRYQRTRGIRDRLLQRWDEDMRPVTRATHLERDVRFEEIEPHLGPFFNRSKHVSLTVPQEKFWIMKESPV